MLLTGGGVASTPEFTDFENRALRSFGSVSIIVDEGTPTLGFEVQLNLNCIHYFLLLTNSVITIAEHDSNSNVEGRFQDLSWSSSATLLKI